jgi:hypothetical protein
MKLTTLLAVVAIGGTACAGPQSHVSIEGQSAALTVAFGKPTSNVVAGNPPLAPVPSGLGVLPVHSPVGVTVVYIDVPGRPPVVPPPPACPTANPLSAPKAVADNTISSPAPKGGFTYRFSGIAVEGTKAKAFTGTSIHTVTSSTVAQPQQDVGGSYRFDIAVPMLGATTTYSYAVVPAAGTAADVKGGIELVQVSGNGGYGYNASFKPDKPLQVFAQPANSGTTWTDAETDVRSGTYATIDGTIDGKDRVNACGVTLDAYKSTAILKVTSPNETITTTVQTWWAPQFGGLPLQEVQSYSGKTAGGVEVKGSLTSIISVDPAAVAKK